MKFTATKLAEQYVQNMYSKPAKETANTKNDKLNNKSVPAPKDEDAATYEGSVKEPPKAT